MLLSYNSEVPLSPANVFLLLSALLERKKKKKVKIPLLWEENSTGFEHLVYIQKPNALP